MPRGQTSTQAEQVVHAQRVSSNIISPTSAGAGKSFPRATPSEPVITVSKCRRTSCTTLRGESGLPASKAGHSCSHRPHDSPHYREGDTQVSSEDGAAQMYLARSEPGTRGRRGLQTRRSSRGTRTPCGTTCTWQDRSQDPLKALLVAFSEVHRQA